MTEHSALAAEYSARQTEFQVVLDKLRKHTYDTERLRRADPYDKEAHDAARDVLNSMAETATNLRAERDRVWHALNRQPARRRREGLQDVV